MDRRRTSASGPRALLLLLPVLLAGACTDPAPPEPPQADEGPLVVGTTEPFGGPDPADCYDAFCAYTLFANTHEGLTRIDPETLEVAGALATGWESSDDGETYRFALREDVAFHDGTPFDAAAMQASLERVRDRGSGGARFLLFGDGGIERISAPSEHTLEVELGRPDAAFPAKLAFPVAAAVPADTPPRPDDPPAGTGPYSVARWEASVVELAGDPSHRADPPEEDGVLMQRLGSSARLRAGVAAGDVHVASRRWDPAELVELRGAEGVALETAPGVAIRFLAFTTNHEPYDEPDLRRAVAAAVDREALVGGPLEGTADPLYGLVPSAFGASRPTFRGLEDTETTADELDLWYTPDHYGEAEEDVATALAGQLEEVGFEVALHPLAWPDLKAFLAIADRGGMVLLGRFPDALDPADHLGPLLGSRGAAALGTGYSSDDMDELLGEQAAATDIERRRELLVRIQELAAADIPYVPLWAPHRVVAAAPGVTGLDLDRAPQLLLDGVRRGDG